MCCRSDAGLASERGIKSRRAAASVTGPVASQEGLGSLAVSWTRLVPRTPWKDVLQGTLASPAYKAFADKQPQVHWFDPP
jgi:hypothetical protein